MENKLQELYEECIKELKEIGIDLTKLDTGSIDIKLSNRSKKNYGYCKQEEPDKKFCKRVKKRRRIVWECNKFNKHTIVISSWVLNLDEKIIKNTIMHELIHCIPYCNNHGKMFKYYAEIINNKLGYSISRIGNKEKDYQNSNLEYEKEIKNYKYEVICQNCGQKVYRQRINKNFTRKYRCRYMWRKI